MVETPEDLKVAKCPECGYYLRRSGCPCNVNFRCRNPDCNIKYSERDLRILLNIKKG